MKGNGVRFGVDETQEMDHLSKFEGKVSQTQELTGQKKPTTTKGK